MKLRPSILKPLVFGLVILPTSFFAMRLLHLLLLNGRDITHQPLLLILLGLAALSLGSVVAFAGFVLFFAAEDAIRRRVDTRQPHAFEAPQSATGLAKLSAEWFRKGVNSFNSHEYAEAIRCFRIVKELRAAPPELHEILAHAEAALSRQKGQPADTRAQPEAAPRPSPTRIPEPLTTELSANEIATNETLLASYATSREGQFALLRKGQLLGFFQDFASALQRGYARSATGDDFTVLPITHQTWLGPRFLKCLS